MKKILLALFTLTSIAFSESISEIQGSTLTSPLVNKEVKNVKGIVTATRKNRFNNGFFMQSEKHDNDLRTSEGIYVENKSGIDVKTGDLVSVNGIVEEIQFGKFDKTQLTTTSIKAKTLEKLAENKKVNPIIVTGFDISNVVFDGNLENLNVKKSALDYYESLEGMLVKIKNPIITGFKEKYGDITIIPSYGKYSDSRSINGGVLYNNYKYEQTQRLTVNTSNWKIVKNSEFINNLTPNPGDKLKSDVEGIIMYEFSEFKLYPTSEFPGIIDMETKPEVNKYTYDENQLNVVSYNIENFSHIDNPERVDILADQVSTILQTPDILGLIEVGDDDGSKSSDILSANENLNAIVNAIKNKTGIEYGIMTVDPQDKKDGGWPEMHIRNAILYRKERLTPINFNQSPNDKNTKLVKTEDNKLILEYNPGRIGIDVDFWDEVRKPLIAQFEFKGKNIFVIANHLKSKRSDNKIYGSIQPVERISEVVRNKQAIHINEFTKEILFHDSNSTVIILGDMNDFEFSNTTKLINGNELIDTISELPKNERYTYVFQGASQTLDNIFINKKYKGNVNVDVIRVNSEFTKSQGSFSDHDPIFIQFEVK